MRLVAQGLTDAQVAERLVISPRTVNSHLTATYEKDPGLFAQCCYTLRDLEHHLI